MGLSHLDADSPIFQKIKRKIIIFLVFGVIIIYNLIGSDILKRCVIVGGAEIKNYQAVKNYLKDDDYVIFCDCGIYHVEKLNIAPNLIVGDFDSARKPEVSVETIILPCEKDDTDTFFAAKEGVKRGFDEFLLVGVFGGRFDHSFANFSLMLWLHNRGKKVLAADDYSEFEIIEKNTAFVEEKYSYFSLINLDGSAHGVTIKNAKYPLDNDEISVEYQYAVSNEVLKGKTAEISLKSGKLLLIKDR